MLGQTDAALRQQASRSGGDPAHFYWRRLQSRADAVELPGVQGSLDLVEAVCPSYSESVPPTVSAAIVLRLIKDLAAGDASEIVAQRYQLGHGVVETIRLRATALAGRLASIARPRAMDTRHAPVADLRHALRLAGLDLSRADQEKYICLARHLSDPAADSGLLSRAVASWMDCRVGDFLSLNSPGQIMDLYFLFHRADVLTDALRVVVQQGGEMDRAASLQAAAISRKDFASVFGHPPRALGAKHHRARPSAYLRWTSRPDEDEVADAAGSLKGLDAWMFAASVFTTAMVPA